MMVIKGSGGEGKSQIGVVLSRLFGCNMKDGSIGKISENRFARADLEHTLLCVDDDMRMEALRQTNYVKSIVTAQGQMDLEHKGKQSYQDWKYARLLAFSNGDLQALYDRSDGFYRRQLILTTREKPQSRADDPDIAEKRAAEVEGILLWAFEGLQRLVKNGFQFTESYRAKRNRELAKRGNNNVFDFLESEGYIRLKSDASTSSKELYKDRILMHIENFTMLIGMLENSLCDHHNAVMAAHPCEVPKKHFARMIVRFQAQLEADGCFSVRKSSKLAFHSKQNKQSRSLFLLKSSLRFLTSRRKCRIFKSFC